MPASRPPPHPDPLRPNGAKREISRLYLMTASSTSTRSSRGAVQAMRLLTP
jgi:hypothetical protein